MTNLAAAICAYQKEKAEQKISIQLRLSVLNENLAIAQMMRAHHEAETTTLDRFLRTIQARNLATWEDSVTALREEIRQKEGLLEQLGRDEDAFVDTICAHKIPAYKALIRVMREAERIKNICGQVVHNNECIDCKKQRCERKMSKIFTDARRNLAKLEAICAIQGIHFALPDNFAISAYTKGTICREEGWQLINSLYQAMQGLQKDCSLKKQFLREQFSREGAK